jgi:A/G-specific adenine glycosylase
MEDQHRKSYFVRHLLDWYKEFQRDLPWRRNKNPYYIWVSEIMLQQTRVDTVIPYFHRFIEKFPTIEALADAPEEEVLKAWEGLGYYSRARNLQSAVREVKEQYASVVPRERHEISALKGVGPYTAGAILSIAYNKPEPAVDGNVMRVLSRYFLIQEDIMKGSTRVYMEHLVRELIPHDAASDFNQALMELGAMVCTPKSPRCLTCPVMEHCAGRLEGMEESLPIKKKSKPPRIEQRLVALVEGSAANKGKILIRQRPQEGLLARMWELPHLGIPDITLNWKGSEKQNADFLRDRLESEDGLKVDTGEWIMNTEHTFSHIHWNMQVYLCTAGNEALSDELTSYRWITLDEREQYAFPNVFLRIMNAYEKAGKL